MRFLSAALLLVAYANAALATPWHLGAMNAPSNLTPPPGRPVVIAIIDDGLHLSHPDIAPFLWRNAGEIPANGVDDDGNGYVDDVHGWDAADDDPLAQPESRWDGQHGTHLATAVTELARRAYGSAAPRHLRLLPIKVTSDHDPNRELSAAYPALDYARTAGADIVLAAWAIDRISTQNEARLARLVASGALVIAAAGNEALDRAAFPAAVPGVLAVAAINAAGARWTNSNFGEFVDLAAPGENIFAPDPLWPQRLRSANGTSLAAALTAGAAALVRRQHPGFSAAEVSTCLLTGSAPLTRPLARTPLGAGALDVAGALTCASALPHAVSGRPRASGWPAARLR